MKKLRLTYDGTVSLILEVVPATGNQNEEKKKKKRENKGEKQEKKEESKKESKGSNKTEV